jgi:hypothetical protein
MSVVTLNAFEQGHYSAMRLVGGNKCRRPYPRIMWHKYVYVKRIFL